MVISSSRQKRHKNGEHQRTAFHHKRGIDVFDRDPRHSLALTESARWSAYWFCVSEYILHTNVNSLRKIRNTPLPPRILLFLKNSAYFCYSFHRAVIPLLLMSLYWMFRNPATEVGTVVSWPSCRDPHVCCRVQDDAAVAAPSSACMRRAAKVVWTSCGKSECVI